MSVKIINKVFRIFFAFILTAMAAGFMLLSVRNYVMPDVSVTKIRDDSMLVKKYYFNGRVKPRKTVEIKAERKMYISEIHVKNGQISQPGTRLITFDVNKQSSTVNTRQSDLRSRIKTAEINKLSLKSSLEALELSVGKSGEAYEKSEEEYKAAAVLYENGAITEKELDDKKYYMDNCRTDYENGLKSLQSETEIYTMNIDRLNGEIKALNDELQLELGGIDDEEYRLEVNKDGTYNLAERIYVEYITDKKVVNEGETIIKYSPCKGNEDMYLEAVLDRNTYEKALGAKSSFYFWKEDRNKRNAVSEETVKEFPDYVEIAFPLSDKTNEKFNLSDSAAFVAQAEERYATVVEKTAVIPIGDLREDNYCYVYLVETEDSIFGKEHVLSQNLYKILAVGDNTVALEPGNSGSRALNSYSIIVNYASSILEDKMNVRVVNR